MLKSEVVLFKYNLVVNYDSCGPSTKFMDLQLNYIFIYLFVILSIAR